jgi:hypothetical protein
MADELTPTTPAPDPRDEKLAALEARLTQTLDTLESLGRSHTAPPSQSYAEPPRPGSIPDHIRRQILASGMSEADLDANAPLILPIVNTYLGTAAQEFLGMIQELKDDLSLMKMPRQRTADGRPAYEHLDAVESDVLKIRDAARKEGRYLSPEQAYHVAVAQNFDRLRTAAEVTTRSADQSARASEPREPARVSTAADLSSMSRDERRKFFDANAETPVG